MATNTSSSSSGGGVGILGLLGVAFVILKLCGVIHWSWWLVTLPFWGFFALGFVALLIWFAVFMVREMRK